MNGIKLFELYTSKGDEYSQTLFTLSIHLGDKLYPLLEAAEKQGKKLSINESDIESPHDSYDTSNVVFI